MANLPLNASLLKNIVSNIPGFYLEDRFFFTPGFPSMSQHMIIEALNKLYPQNKPKYRLTLTAFCSENDLVYTMQKVPSHIDMSSLPQIDGDIRTTEISIASINEQDTTKYFNIFINYLENNNIKYKIETKELQNV
jgi:molybdopterin-biosynthesis enzyme MoeA-like protein